VREFGRLRTAKSLLQGRSEAEVLASSRCRMRWQAPEAMITVWVDGGGL